MKFSEEKK